MAFKNALAIVRSFFAQPMFISTARNWDRARNSWLTSSRRWSYQRNFC